jgi:DNA processing protein
LRFKDFILFCRNFHDLSQTLLQQIALTLVPNIGCVQAKILVTHFEGDVQAIFKSKIKDLSAVEGIGEVRAKSIKYFDDFKRAEEELAFVEKYKFQTLFLTDTLYPKKLLNAYDSPTLLYYRGDADLNASKIVAIVGTRNNTDYGKQITEKLVKELSDQQVLILSGLAFGVDAIAHRAALKNKLPTVGVLAHGLDKIYPSEHAKLAKEMLLAHGGLLTEFKSGTKPDRHNFPTRNRIVAAMADATVVIETDLKGGSMITAELANGYNKDVFAYPGKSTDAKSAGCNHLIKHNKASLITNGEDLVNMMGWQQVKAKPKKQRELFVELSPNEKVIVDLLVKVESIHIDELYLQSGLTSGEVASALLTLELQSLIVSLPGKMIKLL